MTVLSDRWSSVQFTDELNAVLAEVVVAMASDSATVLLLGSTKTALEPLTSVGLDRTPRLATRVPLGQGFAGRVALTRAPTRLDEITADNVLNPVLHAHGIRSVVGVPLIEGDELLGVLHVGSRSPARFAPADEMRLLAISKQVVAMVRAHLRESEHSAAEVLQRSLLPVLPARLDGLEAAVRYLPAEGELGGDWYDLFELPDGRLGVVMGDVVGHGLQAAVVMGRLKSALRAYALVHEDPAEVLSMLDRKISHFEGGALATVLLGVAEPPYREFRFSSAGHWPPVLATRDGVAGPIDLAQDLLLGVDPSRPRRSTTVVLPDDAVLCFYTDGLIERRSDRAMPGALDARLGRLGDVLDPARSAEENCRDVVAALVAQDVIEDDVALMVLRS